MNLPRHLVEFLGRNSGAEQDYLHRAAEQEERRKGFIDTSSGMQTHDPSAEATKTHISDQTEAAICHNFLKLILW
jgi:hypothetical protein